MFGLKSDKRLQFDERNAMIAGLPLDTVIYVCQFMLLDDLFNFARCNVFLFKTFFNQTPNRTKQLVELKTPTWIMKMTNQKIPEIVDEKLIAEYGKDELECKGNEFMPIQMTVWKPLVCFYFPKFQQAVEVRNWMHVLRRRILHLQVHSPHLLPLGKHFCNTKEDTTFKINPSFKVEQYEEDVIENCDWIYKCPLKYDELDDSSLITDENSKYCQACQRQVYHVRSMKEMQEHASKGHCVAFTSKTGEMKREMIMGKPYRRVKKKFLFF